MITPKGTKSDQYLSEDEKIDREFLQIRTAYKKNWRSSNISDEARSPENRSKNRYPDILPIEQTRVKLQLDNEDQDQSDYINANYVSDLSATGRPSQIYICCQAPLLNTFTDFWRMIWQKKCPVIVMLTRLIEHRVVKADLYWPEENEAEEYGKILVRCISLSTTPENIIVRRFRICRVENPLEEREVVHLHYTDWPDKGVPKASDAMRDLIVKLDLVKGNLNEPIVVHCSAGVGRTGAFLAIHMTTQQIAWEGVAEIDLQRTVMNLRKQRIGMVQSRDQYKFVYKTVNMVLALKYQLKDPEEKYTYRKSSELPRSMRNRMLRKSHPLLSQEEN
eukprot:TRINITY_DN8089_c0_g1_i1.p1 TRINITY_DN8089_c0_g1~~TRINITY_DN8089_c0_g1_i1.p1  ORF type:complete len:334 (+),score=52.76 TRINITY_DN8089_c0_g1_i1:124-1125(+)